MNTVQPRPRPRAPSWRVRRILTAALLVVTTVLAIAAIASIWAERQLLNPDNWANTSTQLLQNQTIRAATAKYIGDQLYDNVDVRQLLSGLPSPLQGLATPAAGALRTAVVRATESALSRPEVQSLWSQANREADRALVAIVDGGGSRVAIDRGTVTLNLRAIVDDAASGLGLPADLGNRLPASAARLTIMRSDQLKAVQEAGRALRGLAVVLSILVPLLYALAIVIAKGRRRRVLVAVGASGICAGVVVLVARPIGISQVVDSLVKDAGVRPAAREVASIATSTLSHMAQAAILIGVGVVIVAWLGGAVRLALVGRQILGAT